MYDTSVNSCYTLYRRDNELCAKVIILFFVRQYSLFCFVRSVQPFNLNFFRKLFLVFFGLLKRLFFLETADLWTKKIIF